MIQATGTSQHSEAFFRAGFFALTDQQPFRWQARLFADRFASGRIPPRVDLPTGLGKTSVVAIWLLALVWQVRARALNLPRRLIYVVNRRTVVDQATDVAERLRHRLRHGAPEGSSNDVRIVLDEIRSALSSLCLDPEDDASPLAISTLRGERADNREWQTDPSRPALIVGTVDMIGSRLLFSGYGVSRRMRPFHAGLLGQDALLVHDEAHLSVPFGALVQDIARRQQTGGAIRPLRVMELSATPRESSGDAFALIEEDLAEPSVAARVQAPKRLRLLDVTDGTEASHRIIDLALRYEGDRRRVLIYVRSPTDARMIADELARRLGDQRVGLLTGIVRGYERDLLADSLLFQGFRPAPGRPLPEVTQYLVATSAGEVGVDLDADHLICDLAPLDSMIQRLGRVNRLGDRQADVHVVVAPDSERAGPLADAVEATRRALTSLPSEGGYHDASPQALLGLAHRIEAFEQVPRCVPMTDVVLDNWSLTRLDDLPGRPLPERWLHGIEGGEPDLYVAWREEVADLVVVDDSERRLREAAPGILRTVYEKHPVLARERVRGPLRAVKIELEKIARRWTREVGAGAPLKAVCLPASGDPFADDLASLLRDDDVRWPNATVVLHPQAGGLDPRGMLDGSAPPDPAQTYDVADLAVTGARERSRIRLTWNDDDGRWSVRRLGRGPDIDLDAAVADARSFGAAVARIRDAVYPLALKDQLAWTNDEGDVAGALLLFAAPGSPETAQDNPASSLIERALQDHLADTERVAIRLLECLGPLASDHAAARRLADAVVLAAAHHDRGKNRDAWQADVGNPRRPDGWQPLAKSGRRGFVARLSGRYRHEFGSLREAALDPTIAAHSERDLILHLIAAHHGWARPHFLPEQWDIADGVTEDENETIAVETMRRFARLQRRFGHWSLAWLEALLRAADYAATEWLARSPTARAPAGRTP